MAADATATSDDGTLADGAPACRSPGCPCTNHSDCAAACVAQRDGSQVCAKPCVGDAQCPIGQRCEQVSTATVCVDPLLTLCDPCGNANDCKAPGAAGAACVQASDGGGRCGAKCVNDGDCPVGYGCLDLTTTAGSPTRQCQPKDGGCTCSPRAVGKALGSACVTTNFFGTCTGKRVCGPGGLGACSAGEAAAEQCNGVDDNCNNATDEAAPCDDDNPCSNDSCGGSKGCQHSDAIEACDDDNNCTVDKCDPKTGCAHTEQPGCAIDVPYKQQFPCGEKAAWQLSAAVAGRPRWTLDGIPSLGAVTPGYKSAACSLNFNLGKSMACAPAGADAHGTATSPFVSAKGITADAALRMRFWLGGNWRAQDKLTIEAAVQGGAWTEAAQFEPPPGGLWQRVEADLVGYVGQVFRVRIKFVAPDCAQANGLVGPFVDDVEIRDVHCKKAVDCDDADICTDDVCIPASKLCAYKTTNTLACSDGNPCTAVDTCKAGVCQGKSTLGGVCDDSNPCTGQDQCSGGECHGTALTSACDDGDPCTSADTCTVAGCTGNTQPCDDSNPCTFDVCDVATGTCATAPASEAQTCDDGDPCTDVGVCHLGACLSRMPCDDSNPCTQDFCSGKNCSHFNMTAGTTCSDSSACSQSDACTSFGQCKGEAAPCGTALQLTTGCAGDPAWQLPNAVTGTAQWQFAAVPASLGGGCALAMTNGQDVACAPGQTAVTGVATRTLDLTGLQRPVLRLASRADVGSDAKVNLRYIDIAPVGSDKVQTLWLTNDDEPNLPWRPLRVDLAAWQGSVVELRLVFDSAGCPPPSGLGWLLRDFGVQAGVSTPCTAAIACEDGSPCTADLCLQSGACSYQAVTGSCDDGNLCTSPDLCWTQGECAGGKLVNCDDKDVCTLDTCGASTGCSHVAKPDGDPCPDGDGCTVGDFCISGKCTVRDKCDDGNPCTQDVCSNGGNCGWTMLNGGKPCDDGNPCTGKDYCSQGTCIGNAQPCALAWQDPVNCGDLGWTTAPLATPGTVTFAVDATPQPPGFHSGGCSLNVNDGLALPCADGKPGTALATSAPIALAGLADPALWLWSWHDVGPSASMNLRVLEVSADGFASAPVSLWMDNAQPAKVWQRVRISLAKVAGKKVQLRLRWAGLGCAASSGKGWFVDDLQVFAAQTQNCSAAIQCSDSDVCTDDTCAAGACVHLPNQATCSDGNACTIADHCWKGNCLAAPAPCEDGNTCSFDSCDPTSGCGALPKVDGAKCDDDNPCSGPDLCKTGVCKGTSSSPDNTPCSDSKACLFAQTCKGGLCQGGTPVGANSPCDDKNPCTQIDQCAGNACKGTPSGCDDFEPCTLDSCTMTADLLQACSSTPLADSSLCDDGDPCTTGTACTAGTCDGPQVPSCITFTGSDFDTGKVPSNWQVDATVGGGMGWKVDALPSPPVAYSPPNSLNFNNDATVDFGLPIKALFQLPDFSVPLQGQAQLTLWSWHDGEQSALKDKRTVEINLSGSTTVLETLQLPNHLRRGLWSKIRISLNKYAGKTIVIKVRYDTVDQFDNETPGWFIDNLRVQTAQPTSCTGDALCVQGKDPCKPTQCLTGVCTPVPLLGACDDGDACTTLTTCLAGACVGPALNCDDDYACSLDLCDTKLGCYHKAIEPCGVFSLPYEATFTCGATANSYWFRDGPPMPGAVNWAIDGTPGVPTPFSPDCALNCNNGTSTACVAGQTKYDVAATSPLIDLTKFKLGTPIKTRMQYAGTWQPAQGEAFVVEMQPLGAKTWTLLTTLAPTPAWQLVAFELTPWAALQLRMRVRFSSACQSGAGAGSGPFVDDFEVFDASCKQASQCNDDNPCTDDSCELSTGVCQAVPNSGPKCDDGNLCTLSDSCVNGQCLGGAKLCNDGKPCTLDSCDPVSGTCGATPAAASSVCSDGQSCTTGDTCQSGNCVGTAKLDGSACSDGNPCSLDDSCTSGVCKAAGSEADGTGCTDGNPCTAGDSCSAGVCQGGKNACDDGDACTQDVCTAVGSVGKTCGHTKSCP